MRLLKYTRRDVGSFTATFYDTRSTLAYILDPRSAAVYDTLLSIGQTLEDT